MLISVFPMLAVYAYHAYNHLKSGEYVHSPAGPEPEHGGNHLDYVASG